MYVHLRESVSAGNLCVFCISGSGSDSALPPGQQQGSWTLASWWRGGGAELQLLGSVHLSVPCLRVQVAFPSYGNAGGAEVSPSWLYSLVSSPPKLSLWSSHLCTECRSNTPGGRAMGSQTSGHLKLLRCFTFLSS